MSTLNVCFTGEITKTAILFVGKNCLDMEAADRKGLQRVD